jgi:OOP family OmpA-OmpF porin
MKKITFLLAGSLLALSCSQSKTSDGNQDAKVQNTESSSTIASAQTSTGNKKFDIESIPVSTIDIGEFPFFTAPKGAMYINNVKVKPFDFIVAATDDSLFEVEGKVFRAWIHEDKNGGIEISNRYLLKSYEDAILAAGGVKIFEGELNGDRLEQYNKLVTYAGDDGSFIPSGGQQMLTYVIRRNDGNVYVILEKKDFATTSLQIVQEKPFQQTIKKITADDIVKDLSEKGKSILYINFAVDKSVITTDGKAVVDQIAKALKNDTSLKIAIEGHTDNTGDGAHNKKLSDDRSLSVMNQLITNGIDKTRLSAKGFGAERPLVANDSEENKAKNRRVELIKVN